jgi:branched-chain amino acid transport system permease protein
MSPARTSPARTSLPGAPLVGTAGGLALLAALPALGAGDGVLHVATVIMIWSIFAVGFDLVFGGVGLLSVGHAAFFGTGGYVLAILTTEHGWPFLPALLAAGVAAALLAGLFSVIALRLSGLFFALVTLALAQFAYNLAMTRLRRWTGGYDGLPAARPELLGIDFLDNTRFYALVAVVFLVMIAGAALLRASPFGQALAAVRQNAVRAEQIGFDTRRLKIAIFAVSGFYSGVAGALLGSSLMFINPEALHWITSGEIVIMTILGGSGTLVGPVIGVATFEILRESLSSVTVHWRGIVGAIFMACTIVAPQGIIGLARAALGRRRRRPA